MPGEVADILNNQDDRLSHLVLNAKAELGDGRRLEVLCESGASLREDRCGRRRARHIADVRIVRYTVFADGVLANGAAVAAS